MKAGLEAEDQYYFVDAVHPTHNPVLGYSWSPRGQRPQVLSNTGRKRLNILGAYNSRKQAYVGFETTDTINALSMIRLIEQLETQQPAGRIILICDNARYNHARLVREHLQTTHSRVELLFLPAYSPNLNLIERLWGFMKERILQDYYPSFDEFRQAICSFFSQLEDYADALLSLMTENFQILNSV